MRNRRRRTLTTIGAAIAVVTALAGCAGAGNEAVVEDGDDLVVDGETIADAELYAAAVAEGELTFYTGGSEQSEQVATAAFAEDTGIQVEIVRLAPNDLTERILSEVGAGKLGADVIRISGEDLTQSVADAGAFTPIELPEDIAAELTDDASNEDGLFYSSYNRVYSFAYNNQLIDAADAPETWQDLLDYEPGQAGIVQVGAGGSTAALTRFQLSELGEDWLRSFAATEPRIFDSSANLTDGLSRGEISVGAIPIATAYGAIQEGAPLTIVAPTDGAAGYPFYVGVSSSAEHPAAAQVFTSWIMSKAGQSLAATQGDFPVRADVDQPTAGDLELPSVDSGWLFTPTADESLTNLKADSDLWTEIFGYTG